jgi:hypothetical protein
MIGLILNNRRLGRCSFFAMTYIAFAACPGRFAPITATAIQSPLAHRC